MGESKFLNMKFAIFIVILFAVGVIAQDKPQVQVSQGIIQGSASVTRAGRKFNQYLGVPFGQVEKRFEISTPAKPWDGVKETVDSGPGCVTSGFYGKPEGIEECLTLDVYVPVLSTPCDEGLPVMVWFYGGAFVEGAANEYNGSYFMDEDVIVVIPNYRLGPFGFLNAGVAGARGNQGHKDQVLALKWVQDNIGRLNGDKNKVTIFGESAGGISVSLLTLSPMAEGLFHRAIIQSASATIPFVYHGVDGPKLAKKLGQAVDCPTSNMEYLVECLRRIDPNVLAPYGNFVDEMGWSENSINMGPSYETFSNGENDKEVFIDKDPYIYAKEGKFTKVPIIMGHVSFESHWSAVSVLQNPELFKKMDKQWGRLLPNLLYFSDSAEDPAKVSSAIRSHFFPNGLTNESLTEFESMISDRHWLHPFRIMASEYAKQTDVYLYNFTHNPKVLTSPDEEAAKYLPTATEGETRRVPCHADELPYFFQLQASFGSFFAPVSNEKGDQDLEMSKTLIKMWTTFAKNGKPGPLWDLEESKWNPIKVGDTLEYLQIQESPKMEKEPESHRRNHEFWESLSLKEFGKVWESEVEQ